MIQLWTIIALVGMTWCALGRMVQLAMARSRNRRLRDLNERYPSGVRRARVIRLFADHYLFAAQISAFAGAALFGVGFAMVMLDLIGASQQEALHSSVARWPLAVTLLIEVVFLGIVPILILQSLRVLAFNRPEICLVLVSRAFLLLTALLSPALYLLEKFTAALSFVTGASIPSERQIVVPDNNLSDIVDQAETQIEEHDRELIRSVVEMSHTVVQEVMTPRADMITVSREDSVAEAIRLFIKEKVSRILVTGEHREDIRGVIHAKDLLGVPLESPSPLREFLRPVARIRGDMKVDDALRQLLTSANHLAIVIDEHGGIAGLVTIEDLLEELVGEIFDEFDSPTEEAPIRRTASGDLIVDGGLPIDEFNSACGANIPDSEEYSTVAGYLLLLLGRIPYAGEVVDLGGLLVKVESVEQNRVAALRVLRSKRSMRVVSGTGRSAGASASGDSAVGAGGDSAAAGDASSLSKLTENT